MATATEAPARGQRRRNRRGQGERLRSDILASAAALLAETGDPAQLSLRGVARRTGITPTSVYLHFADIGELAAAVLERSFAALTAAGDAAEATMTDPALALLARVRGYARFGLANPGHYRAMFGADMVPAYARLASSTPGRRSFEVLVERVRRCLEAGFATPYQDARALASLVWATEHGLVALRLSRPQFPWAADVEEMVAEAVGRVMGFVDHAGRSRAASSR